MGCANSKLNPEGEVVPPRIRPLLRHRFLEMRKRRNAILLKDGNLSKKELLKDGADEDDNSPPDSLLDSKSSSSSPEDSTSSSKAKRQENIIITLQTVGDCINGEGRKECDEYNNNATNEQEKKDGKEERNDSKLVLVEGEATEEEIDDEDDDEEEDGRSDKEEDQLICPGSPSFRVYFLEATENEKLTSEAQEDSVHNEPQSHDSVTNLTSTTSNGVQQEIKTSKKGKRGAGFRRAIRKGGPVAVKNLLNVKSCYHPGCSGHDRASLLTEKPAT